VRVCKLITEVTIDPPEYQELNFIRGFATPFSLSAMKPAHF